MMRSIVLFIVSFMVVSSVHVVLAAPDLPDILEDPGAPDDSPDELFPPSVAAVTDDASAATGGGSVNLSDSDHASNDTDIAATNLTGDSDHEEVLVDVVSSIDGSRSDAGPVGGEGSASHGSPDVALKKERSRFVLVMALVVIVGLLMFVFLTRKKR